MSNINKKAISQLDRISSSIASIGEETDYTEVAIEALEKQIPKKPNNIKFLFDFSGDYYTNRGDCPNCGEELFRSSRYCNKCGQALDWGEENGKG